MTPIERLVIVGGDAAGMSAASQARRRRPDLKITAFERSPHASFSACGIPYYVGKLIEHEDSLIARSPEAFAKSGIDVHANHEVEEIDHDKGQIRVRSIAEGRTFTEPFDQLVIATGAMPIKPDLPGADAAGIYSIAVLQDGVRVRQAVDAERPKHAVIVGGGYIGLEMAEALLMRGVHVSMVTRGTEVMSTLDPDMGALASQALRDAGVDLYTGEAVQAFETRNGRVTGVQTSDRLIPAGIVILGIGTRPNSGLAERAGLPIGQSRAIVVDDRMRTAADGIWAAGDCVESFHLISRRPVHIALGTVASKQGRICGINIGGEYARFPGVLGTAITKICEIGISRTGLNEREASAAGIEYSVGRIESTDRAGYYPDAGHLTIKVLAEKGSGRLLGAQIVGTGGAAKRIDVFATALTTGMTANEFSYLDLSYAPPFSSTWDPVLIAARKAVENA